MLISFFSKPSAVYASHLVFAGSMTYRPVNCLLSSIMSKHPFVCSLSKNSATAKLIMDAKLIIWDEAPMMSKECYECVDRSFRDIMGIDLPFGGKVMVFGGDFRQVLPIVRRGNRAQAVNAALSRSHLWPNMRHMRLVKNMRVHRLQGKLS